MSPALTAQTCSTLSDLRTFRSEWDHLTASAQWMAAQTSNYVFAALEHAPDDARPAVVLIRSGNELVGVWPLIVRQKSGIRFAVHPGGGGLEEYAGPLIKTCAQSEDIARLAIVEAAKSADVVTAYNVPASSPMARAARSMHHVFSWSVDSYVVGLKEFDSWDAWLKSKSKNFRQNLGGQRRALAKQGDVRATMDEPDILPWFFKTKRDWLAERNKHSAWVHGDNGEEFFIRLSQSGLPLKTFGLRLNGHLIAAGLCLRSSDRLEYYATTYEKAGGVDKYSPGMLVSEDCGRWAQEQGLDLDFRFMDVPYKDRWKSHTEPFESFAIATRWKGRPHLAALRARNLVKAARRRAGRLLRRLKAGTPSR